jgi:hypothetical protein
LTAALVTNQASKMMWRTGSNTLDFDAKEQASYSIVW